LKKKLFSLGTKGSIVLCISPLTAIMMEQCDNSPPWVYLLNLLQKLN